jgi:hypothetical protein
MTEKELTSDQIADALYQALCNPNLPASNPHLTTQELDLLRSIPPIFPIDKPVFSPYKPTKKAGQYTQVRYQGRKYYIHRIACAYKHGPAPPNNQQASHLMAFSNDFNPNNLVWEDSDVNKGRIACSARYRLVMEFEKIEWDIAWNKQEMSMTDLSCIHDFAINNMIHETCSKIHDPPCKFWHPTWGNSSPPYLICKDSVPTTIWPVNCTHTTLAG